MLSIVDFLVLRRSSEILLLEIIRRGTKLHKGWLEMSICRSERAINRNVTRSESFPAEMPHSTVLIRLPSYLRSLLFFF